MYQLLLPALLYAEGNSFFLYDAFCFCPEKMTDRARCWEDGWQKLSQAKPSQASFLRATRVLHALRSQASLISFFKKLAPHTTPPFHFLL